MKFIISNNTLLKGLQNISGILSTNSLIPIIENFLFELDNDKLIITATDNETRASVTLTPDNIEGVGKVAIPPKILQSTLKTFPDIPITLSIDEESFSVDLIAGEGSYHIAGYDPSSYPENTIIEDATKISFNSIILHNAISNTLFACSNDELRPQLSGVNFEFTPDYTNFVSTDAHKLVRFRRTDLSVDEAISFTASKKPLNVIKNLLVNFDTDVTLQFNNTNVSFSFNEYNITCRLLEGKFPEHEKVIPHDNQSEMIIDREKLLTSLKRVAIFASQSSNQVKLEIKGQELTIEAEDRDFSNNATEKIQCEYNGQDLTIGYNSKFLIDVLSTLVSTEVKFMLSESNRATLIFPQENIENEDILMLIMPVMIE